MTTYQAYWGLTFNPFTKDIRPDLVYESKDYKGFCGRMEYFKATKGFAVAYGESGSGKTTSIRAFVSKLNPQVFKTIYLPLSSVTVMDFYRHLASCLGLIPRYRKVDLFHDIQEHIVNLVYQKNITPFIIIDEAQYLQNAVLNDLRMVFNFQMDSKNLAMVLLVGQPYFIVQLNLRVHEALRNRIMVHYEFRGLDREEIKDYLGSLLKTAGATSPIFAPDAIEAIGAISNGLPQRINSLAEKALIIGFQKQITQIGSEIIELAQEEIDLLIQQ